MRNNRKYIKIWTETYGPIPKDEYGRSYEIHHIDGNHNNNSLDNLKLVTINEHYDIHYSQGDYGACYYIALRMKKTPEELSIIVSDLNRNRTGKKNPFYGKKHTEETKRHLSEINSKPKGKYSEEHKKNISNGLIAYKRTVEHASKLRASKNTEDYKKKIRKKIYAYGTVFNSIKDAKEVYGHSKIWSGLKNETNRDVYYYGT